ncbi:MAG TPA: AsmA family protein [Acetobacteraceae bacterium]|nr:AsmA family protein [Acetobacteraceae bacterium]
MRRTRALKWLAWIGLPVAAVVAIVFLWNWDWFASMVASRASADIGRPVSIAHLHVRLGRITTIAVDDVVIANPPGWPSDPPLARVQRIVAQVDLLRYIFHRQLVVPVIEIDHPLVQAAEAPNGNTNWRLDIQGGSGNGTQIGDLRVAGGQAHVFIPRLRADFQLAIDTREQPGHDPELLVQARGTYAGEPIAGRMIGGAILALRDNAHPWPINLQLANGPTQVELVGSVREPLALAGADLRLRFAGPDMGLLEPLTGIPIPKTPPFQVTGRLDFANHHVLFQDIAGRVGSSDLEGSIAVDPGQPKQVVQAQLHSRSVNLVDLGGFIGAKPGAGTTPAEAASPTLLPTKPIHVPELHWADVHLRYQAGRIQGRSMPLDNLTVALDIVNGEVVLHPVSFGVGPGRIVASLRMVPAGRELRTNGQIDFQSVDVAKLMAATHLFHGAGRISGSGKIVTVGNSVAEMAANGNGEVAIGMVGGDLSAILVDLSGLEFGNALLSALGVPKNTKVECMVTDFALQRGVLNTRALVLDTGEALVTGTGTVNLGNEKLDLQIRTTPQHFTIGSLAGPINIGGTFKHPSIMPGAETFVRGGLAAGLGVLLAPLALLPTIQFGANDHQSCDKLLAEARSAAPGTKLPIPKNLESSR